MESTPSNKWLGNLSWHMIATHSIFIAFTNISPAIGIPFLLSLVPYGAMCATFHQPGTWKTLLAVTDIP